MGAFSVSRTTLALFALIAGLAGALGGYFYGHSQGVTAESARRDGQAVQQLTGLMDAHKNLIADAGKASRAMRQATAARQSVDTQSTKEFADALALTAASRAGCSFDAGVMRQLAAARDRAAQAAAGGLRHPLPAASASTQRPGD